MTTKSILITTLTIALTILSCKKENPEPNAPKSGEEQENPIGGDTIPTSNTNIGFLVCAGGSGGTNNKYIYFNDLDSIVLRKLDQNQQTYEYTELSKITVLPSDFHFQPNWLTFTSNYINQSVLSQLGNVGGYKVEMSIYLSVPFNYIQTHPQTNKTNRMFDIHNISSGTYSPCQASRSFNKLSVGDDANRCKLVGIH